MSLNHTVSFAFGLYILWNQEYLWNFKLMVLDYPHHVSNRMKMKLYVQIYHHPLADGFDRHEILLYQLTCILPSYDAHACD